MRFRARDKDNRNRIFLKKWCFSFSITNTKRYRTYIFHCPFDGKRFNRTYFRMMTRVPFGTILYSLLTLERGMFTHPWEPLYL